MNAKLSAILMTSLLVGCSTGRHVDRNFTVHKGQPVEFTQDQFPLGYHDKIIAVLERNGFTMAKAGQATPVRCIARIEHGLTTVTAYLQLIRDDHNMIVIRSENHGWGTWMAPDSAKEDRIGNAIQEFDRALAAIPKLDTAPSRIEQLEQRAKELELEKKIKDLEAQLAAQTNATVTRDAGSANKP